MSVPWTAALAARVLRGMDNRHLAAITPASFQRWPAPNPLPAAIGRELIAAERAARARESKA